MASFFGWVNVTGLVLQTFFVSRHFQSDRSRGRALFIMPAIALTGYSVILVAPLLGLVRVLKILDNSTDYSIQNTARQALFLPTSREAKYKAKAAIDSFFMAIWRCAPGGHHLRGYGSGVCRCPPLPRSIWRSRSFGSVSRQLSRASIRSSRHKHRPTQVANRCMTCRHGETSADVSAHDAAIDGFA